MNFQFEPRNRLKESVHFSRKSEDQNVKMSGKIYFVIYMPSNSFVTESFIMYSFYEWRTDSMYFIVGESYMLHITLQYYFHLKKFNNSIQSNRTNFLTALDFFYKIYKTSTDKINSNKNFTLRCT